MCCFDDDDDNHDINTNRLRDVYRNHTYESETIAYSNGLMDAAAVIATSAISTLEPAVHVHVSVPATTSAPTTPAAIPITPPTTVNLFRIKGDEKKKWNFSPTTTTSRIQKQSLSSLSSLPCYQQEQKHPHTNSNVVDIIQQAQAIIVL